MIMKRRPTLVQKATLHICSVLCSCRSETRQDRQPQSQAAVQQDDMPAQPAAPSQGSEDISQLHNKDTQPALRCTSCSRFTKPHYEKQPKERETHLMQFPRGCINAATRGTTVAVLSNSLSSVGQELQPRHPVGSWNSGARNSAEKCV